MNTTLFHSHINIIHYKFDDNSTMTKIVGTNRGVKIAIWYNRVNKSAFIPTTNNNKT